MKKFLYKMLMKLKCLVIQTRREMSKVAIYAGWRQWAYYVPHPQPALKSTESGGRKNARIRRQRLPQLRTRSQEWSLIYFFLNGYFVTTNSPGFFLVRPRKKLKAKKLKNSETQAKNSNSSLSLICTFRHFWKKKSLKNGSNWKKITFLR